MDNSNCCMRYTKQSESDDIHPSPFNRKATNQESENHWVHWIEDQRIKLCYCWGPYC